MVQSLAAWLNLADDEELWLEVSEDYSVRSGGAAADVQVKTSRAAAGPTAYSLQSADVRAALNRFWSRSSHATSTFHRLTFIANGGTAQERDYTFPDGSSGLDYWKYASIDADTTPLRTVLGAIFADDPLGSWIAGNPPDTELREKLLRRVQWTLRSASIDVLMEQINDQVLAIHLTKGYPLTITRLVSRSLLDRVFQTASEANPDFRVLNKRDLGAAFEEAIATLTLSFAAKLAPTHPHVSSHSLLVTELTDELKPATLRTRTIEEILAQTRGAPAIWIYGSHGVGKSTLARLLGMKIGGRWLTLDLRPVQKEAAGSLAAWRELLQELTRVGIPDGIIIDDFAEVGMDVLRWRLAELARTVSARGGRIIVTSPQAPTPARAAELGQSAKFTVQAPYFTEEDVLDLITAADSPEPNQIRAWAIFIRASTNSGHPLLTTAKVSSLRARGWPSSGLLEDIRETSDSVRATREEARRLLLRELSGLDAARSLDAGRLLRRIGCVFDRVDDGLARHLAQADPPIQTAGDALAILKGAWLEALPGKDFRVSPLLGDITSDVDLQDASKWRRLAAEYWLKGKVLNERTLPLCFWNAFLGNHDWVLFKLCEVMQGMSPQALRGAAALLSPVAFFRTDRSIYPKNEIFGVQLRLLQFDVANAIEEWEIAGNISTRLLTEIEQVPYPELRDAMTTVAASKVLMAHQARVAPIDLLQYAHRLRSTNLHLAKLNNLELSESENAILQRFGGKVDLASVFLAGGVSRIENADDIHAMFLALDKIAAEDRNKFFDASSQIYGDLTVFVHSGWVRDQLEDRDMEHALQQYNEIEVIAGSWDRHDVMIALACARSIILDEGLKSPDAAISVVDAAIGLYGLDPSLVRQKSKVLGHHGRDSEATDLLISVEETVGHSSSFDRALALRDGGVSAARIKRFDDAVRLFERAHAAAMEDGERSAFAAGLLVDKAMALWFSGQHVEALKCLADTLDQIENLDPTTSRKNEHVHQYARAAVGLFLHETEAFPTARLPIVFGGASKIFSDDEPLQNVDLKPLRDNWRVLALVEIKSGYDAGINHRSILKRHAGGNASVETMILCAIYSRSIISSELSDIIQAGLNATVAMRGLTLKGLVKDIDLNELTAIPIETMLVEPEWRESVLRIVVDILFWQKLQHKWSLANIDEIERVWTQILRRTDSIFKAATGRYAIGIDAPFSYATAALIASSEETLDGDPHMRFQRDLTLVGHIFQSCGRYVLEPPFIESLISGWATVLDKQRFMLRNPAQNCPGMEQAIVDMEKEGLPAAARLVLAAAPAMAFELGPNWQKLLARVLN